MAWRDDVPIVLYDDKCAACSAFASAVRRAAGGRVRTVGHYTQTGAQIRSEVLEGDALSMFWFLDQNTAYGGRAALLPLARQVLSGRGPKRGPEPDGKECSSCRDPRSVLLRSASLLSHSRKISMGGPAPQ